MTQPDSLNIAKKNLNIELVDDLKNANFYRSRWQNIVKGKKFYF